MTTTLNVTILFEDDGTYTDAQIAFNNTVNRVDDVPTTMRRVAHSILAKYGEDYFAPIQAQDAARDYPCYACGQPDQEKVMRNGTPCRACGAL